MHFFDPVENKYHLHLGGAYLKVETTYQVACIGPHAGGLHVQPMPMHSITCNACGPSFKVGAASQAHAWPTKSLVTSQPGPYLKWNRM